MIWAIVQLSTKETQFFCVMKIIDGGVLPEFPNRRVWSLAEYWKKFMDAFLPRHRGYVYEFVPQSVGHSYR